MIDKKMIEIPDSKFASKLASYIKNIEKNKSDNLKTSVHIREGFLKYLKLPLPLYIEFLLRNNEEEDDYDFRVIIKARRKQHSIHDVEVYKLIEGESSHLFTIHPNISETYKDRIEFKY